MLRIFLMKEESRCVALTAKHAFPKQSPLKLQNGVSSITEVRILLPLHPNPTLNPNTPSSSSSSPETQTNHIHPQHNHATTFHPRRLDRHRRQSPPPRHPEASRSLQHQMGAHRLQPAHSKFLIQRYNKIKKEVGVGIDGHSPAMKTPGKGKGNGGGKKSVLGGKRKAGKDDEDGDDDDDEEEKTPTKKAKKEVIKNEDEEPSLSSQSKQSEPRKPHDPKSSLHHARSIPSSSSSSHFSSPLKSLHPPTMVLWDERKDRHFLMCIIQTQSITTPDWKAVAEKLNSVTGEKFSGNALRYFLSLSTIPNSGGFFCLFVDARDRQKFDKMKKSAKEEVEEGVGGGGAGGEDGEKKSVRKKKKSTAVKRKALGKKSGGSAEEVEDGEETPAKKKKIKREVAEEDEDEDGTTRTGLALALALAFSGGRARWKEISLGAYVSVLSGATSKCNEVSTLHTVAEPTWNFTLLNFLSSPSPPLGSLDVCKEGYGTTRKCSGHWSKFFDSVSDALITYKGHQHQRDWESGVQSVPTGDILLALNLLGHYPGTRERHSLKIVKQEQNLKHTHAHTHTHTPSLCKACSDKPHSVARCDYY
ncbi:uncharacterized protein MYCFIDRAFT_176027 [Pseudocercospora fijiensis CIRAD86]|uniref:Uncharacterized protein n=1 Tax=Pseudocercospora fijiensis (strain CIRAD86) TaxID=383855 RepID=M2ZU03_PSEFD|nr:uncharacterized protein MYCFIDRAFT_176027 [Pseudocercospora fijiensis CIRAD86]EME82484.1 hypothetical protein MYCFIDRAFT_176027 [Pseudocercospora fijiensis CIRAD86]